jgi:hypothetical protein
MVPTRLEDIHTASPSDGKMVTSSKTRPIATGVLVIYHGLPTSHVRPATAQIWAPTTLTEIEDVLSEKTAAICLSENSRWSIASGSHNIPPVAGVGTPISEEHTCMTTMFKHFKSYHRPTRTEIP